MLRAVGQELTSLSLLLQFALILLRCAMYASAS